MTGGIVAATVEQYEAVNGHSNRFWGWGAEGTDLYYRFDIFCDKFKDRVEKSYFFFFEN